MENKGQSAARNTGIRHAIGEWIMFVDADDWVEADMLEVMVKEAESSSCDLCISGHTREYPNHSERREFSRLAGYSLNNTDKLILFTESLNTNRIGSLEDIFIRTAWAKLYRKKVLLDNNIMFVNGLSTSEDILFNMYVIELSTKIIFIKDVFYHYRMHPFQKTKRYDSNMFDTSDKYLHEVYRFANRFYSGKDAVQIYNFEAVHILKTAIALTYMAKNSPYSLRGRILGIKALINKEPYNYALHSVSYNTYNRNHKIQLWFLRHMPVSLYYSGMKAIDWLRRKKTKGFE